MAEENEIDLLKQFLISSGPSMLRQIIHIQPVEGHDVLHSRSCGEFQILPAGMTEVRMQDIGISVLRHFEGQPAVSSDSESLAHPIPGSPEF